MKYIIRFKDRSKKIIDEEKFERINTITTTPNAIQNINIEGSIYNLSSIDKLLPEGEYYEQYPNERPAFYDTDEYKALNEPSKPVKLNTRKRELILAGIEEVVGKNDFYLAVKKVIDKKEYLNTQELMGN